MLSKAGPRMPSVILWQKLQWMKHFQSCCWSPVLGQLKADIPPYVVINKKDDDRHGAFINAQKIFGRIMHEKEQCFWKGKKRNNK